MLGSRLQVSYDFSESKEHDLDLKFCGQGSMRSWKVYWLYLEHRITKMWKLFQKNGPMNLEKTIIDGNVIPCIHDAYKCERFHKNDTWGFKKPVHASFKA